MKKFILTLAAAILSVGIISAQDMAQATEIYNQGAQTLQEGDYAGALTLFQQALAAGEAIGEEAAELVTNCKNVIPNIVLQIGKDLVKASQYQDAIAKLEEAAQIAEKYGSEEVMDEAKALIPQVKVQEGLSIANAAFDAKDLKAAAEGYKNVLELDPTNGSASIRLVQCLANLGDLEGAEAALESARANGQGANAEKTLLNAYLRQAQALNKGGKPAEAIKAALKAQTFGENPNIDLIAGQAYQKLNKNADAIKSFEKYIEASPNGSNTPAIIFTVAALYQQSGNKAKALENYKKIASDAKYGAQAKQQIDALSK